MKKVYLVTYTQVDTENSKKFGIQNVYPGNKDLVYLDLEKWMEEDGGILGDIGICRVYSPDPVLMTNHYEPFANILAKSLNSDKDDFVTTIYVTDVVLLT